MNTVPVKFNIKIRVKSGTRFSATYLAEGEFSQHSKHQYINITRLSLQHELAAAEIELIRLQEAITEKSFILPVKILRENLLFSIGVIFFEAFGFAVVSVEVFYTEEAELIVRFPLESSSDFYGTVSTDFYEGIEDPCVKVPIFFGTTREQLGNDKNCTFGLSKTSELKIGQSFVSVPDFHETGKLERPKWYQKLFTEPSPKNHFVVVGSEALSPEEFQRRFQRKLAETDDQKEVLLYIHGFWMSFEDSLLIAAQIGYDLSFQGAICAFSWPSRNGLLKYGADYDSARASANELVKYLEILAKSDVTRIHIIAHSMGNITLSEALRDIGLNDQLEHLKSVIGEVILAAPDVSQFNFQNTYYPTIRPIAKRYTLYACDEDFALKLSKLLRASEKRLGSSKDGIVVLEGMDSIDGTGIGTRIFALNHSQYSDSKVILDDIHSVLIGETPLQRFLKQVIQTPPETGYWKFAHLDIVA